MLSAASDCRAWTLARTATIVQVPSNQSRTRSDWGLSIYCNLVYRVQCALHQATHVQNRIEILLCIDLLYCQPYRVRCSALSRHHEYYLQRSVPQFNPDFGYREIREAGSCPRAQLGDHSQPSVDMMRGQHVSTKHIRALICNTGGFGTQLRLDAASNRALSRHCWPI